MWIVSDALSPTLEAIIAESKGNGYDVVWYDEKLYPFTMGDVKSLLACGGSCGWYFQQLLKLYAARTLPGVRDFVIFDADLIFYKNFQVVAQMEQVEQVEDGPPQPKVKTFYYNVAGQNHVAYFELIEKVHTPQQNPTQHTQSIPHARHT